jgi:hypothetical protein
MNRENKMNSNTVTQLIVYGVEGLIILLLIINQKKKIIKNPAIIVALGILFIILGAMIFYWEVLLK